MNAGARSPRATRCLSEAATDDGHHPRFPERQVTHEFANLTCPTFGSVRSIWEGKEARVGRIVRCSILVGSPGNGRGRRGGHGLPLSELDQIVALAVGNVRVPCFSRQL